MNEIVKLLDTNLKYLDHTVVDDTIYIFVESLLDTVTCPFCGTLSNKRHSTYQRSFQDLPIQGKKVEIVIRLCLEMVLLLTNAIDDAHPTATQVSDRFHRQQGYTGSSSTVRNYIAEWKKKYKINTTTDQGFVENANIII